jgi:hypothetical protein
MRYLVCRFSLENGKEKFKNPCDSNSRIWHDNFDSAKAEAERLSLKEYKEFRIFAELASINPSTKTIFKDFR